MTRLSVPDLAIVAVYIAGMTLLGVYFTRKQKDRTGSISIFRSAKARTGC